MQVLVHKVIVNFEQIGDEGENLVILHGWGRSLAEWKATAFLCSKKYKVTVLDFPGFGSSEEPNEVWDIYEYAQFTREFLLKIGIEKAVLMGHSFGGRIGTILASKNPEMVSRLILVDPGGIEIKSIQTKLKIIAFKLLKPIKNIFGKKIRRYLGSSDYKATSGTMRKIFIKIINQDLRYLFGLIAQPVYVLWGSRDMVLPVSYTKIYKKYIPHAFIKIIWDADHSPYLSNQKDFFDAIVEILDI